MKAKIYKAVQIVLVIIIMKLLPPVRLLIFLTFIFLSIKKSVTMAFADPEDINYKRKTDKELFAFLLQFCIVAFLFALISFQVFIYIALLFWFYFIIFALMFSKIWIFHGKNRKILFAILIVTIIISFIAAPFIRAIIPESLIYSILL